jgi:riboflavin biosynthesis pyrimidine reductase
MCKEPAGSEESGIKQLKKRAHEKVQVEGGLFLICSFLPLLYFDFSAFSRLYT